MGYWSELALEMDLHPSTREGRARLSILLTLLLFGAGGVYAFLEWF